MRKLVILFAAVLGITILFVGCSSIPDNVNMSGKWKYNYGKDLAEKGSMTLSQQDTTVTGVANNVDGQYQINGTITGDQFSYAGKSEKNEYTANCTLSSVDEFEGTYNSTDGGSGIVEATRQ